MHKKDNEGAQAYILRVNDVINQMRGLGDVMPEPLAIGKLLTVRKYRKIVQNNQSMRKRKQKCDINLVNLMNTLI